MADKPSLHGNCATRPEGPRKLSPGFSLGNLPTTDSPVRAGDDTPEIVRAGSNEKCRLCNIPSFRYHSPAFFFKSFPQPKVEILPIITSIFTNAMSGRSGIAPSPALTGLSASGRLPRLKPGLSFLGSSGRNINHCLGPSGRNINHCLGPSDRNINHCLVPSGRNIDHCLVPSGRNIDHCLVPSGRNINRCLVPLGRNIN
jgi:hypothetical protein